MNRADQRTDWQQSTGNSAARPRQSGQLITFGQCVARSGRRSPVKASIRTVLEGGEVAVHPEQFS